MPVLPQSFTNIAGWISGSPVQDASLYLLRNVPGFPPIIQTVHIIGISVLMGTIVMLNLRILGLAVRSQDIGEMTQRLMPWMWSALVVNIISGSVLVFGRPNRYFNNPVFAWKLSFLLPAIILTAIYYVMSRRQPQYWQLNSTRVLASKLMALASLGLWIMTIMAGRWIAYVEYIYYPA